ncbi:hypothetical protein [Isachenkonia alkalipeptolytica]|uniref:Uncharacterized protein n=1 Tax=Isachenkonia alkalipeptolytica TaxID=2565777 RepID=A0AA43XJ05_9CLOT|nr:hypothetical protein [Isachenkonia alkalipeptolytica]NBG87683.1 hypothetical protein [Isachenkonia alkalipeptolytica]
MKSLNWDDIKSFANSKFHVFATDDGLDWCKKSWEMISSRGMNTFNSDEERLIVELRVLTLGIIYNEFFDLIDHEYFDDSMIESEDWLCEDETMLLCSFYNKYPDPENRINKINDLIDDLSLRSEIARTLVSGYGGPDRLFISLLSTAYTKTGDDNYAYYFENEVNIYNEVTYEEERALYWIYQEFCRNPKENCM